MPTGPTGTPSTARHATTRERTVIDELYRTGEDAPGEREAGPNRPGLPRLVELIDTRHRLASNGFFGDPDADG